MGQLPHKNYSLARNLLIPNIWAVDLPTRIQWTAPSATAKQSRSAIHPLRAHCPSEPGPEAHTSSQGTFRAASRRHEGWHCERSPMVTRIETCPRPEEEVISATRGVGEFPERGSRSRSEVMVGLRGKRDCQPQESCVVDSHPKRSKDFGIFRLARARRQDLGRRSRSSSVRGGWGRVGG